MTHAAPPRKSKVILSYLRFRKLSRPSYYSFLHSKKVSADCRVYIGLVSGVQLPTGADTTAGVELNIDRTACDLTSAELYAPRCCTYAICNERTSLLHCAGVSWIFLRPTVVYLRRLA